MGLLAGLLVGAMMVVVEQVGRWVGSGRAGKVHRLCPLVIACLPVIHVHDVFCVYLWGYK